MKHILNNISRQEKNSILEQYSGGKRLQIENFSKLVNSKFGDVKTLPAEDERGNHVYDVVYLEAPS
jgi:hypothetical protein